MAKSIRKRRLEAKTDYRARLEMLKSEKARMVVRKTNRYIIAQIVTSEGAQDKIVYNLTSKDLLDKGWPKEKSGSLKSLPAAYLTGYMLGKMAKDKVKEAIMDMGMNRNVKKSRIYAVLKGAVDAGLKVPHSATALLSEEEINRNKNLADLFDKVKKNI